MFRSEEFPRVIPGESYSADAFNRMISLVERLSYIGAQSGIINDSTGIHLVSPPPESFPAIITGNSSGAYAWEQRDLDISGNVVTPTSYISGTTTADPAYEFGGSTTVATNALVRMFRGEDGVFYFHAPTSEASITVQDDAGSPTILSGVSTLTFDASSFTISSPGTGEAFFVPRWGTTSEIADIAGTEAAGSSELFARADHVHALDAIDWTININSGGTLNFVSGSSIAIATGVSIALSVPLCLDDYSADVVADLDDETLHDEPWWRLNPTAVRDFSGIDATGAGAGCEILISNVSGAGNTLTILDQSTDSLAGNRFMTPDGNDWILYENESVWIVRDDLDSVWRVIGKVPNDFNESTAFHGNVNFDTGSVTYESTSDVYVEGDFSFDHWYGETIGTKTFGATENAATFANSRGVYLCEVAGGGTTLNGIDATPFSAGARLELYNDDGTDTLTIAHNDAAAAAADRILCPNDVDVEVASGSSVRLIYDGTATKWLVLFDVQEFQEAPGNANQYKVTDESGLNAVWRGGNVTTVTSNTTLVANDRNELFLIDASSGVVNVTLPDSAAMGDGWPVYVGRSDLSSNAGSVLAAGADTIETRFGSLSTVTLDNTGAHILKLMSDGAGAWWVVGEAGENLGTITPSPAYTVTNDATDRNYDANSTSVAELADVLGTLIADLQTAGILG